MTAGTPGIFSASVASMDLIFAWAYGLRTMSSHSWPGRLTSSMYSPRPRMMRGSSLRLTEWPMPPMAALVRGSASVVIPSLPAQPAATGVPVWVSAATAISAAACWMDFTMFT